MIASANGTHPDHTTSPTAATIRQPARPHRTTPPTLGGLANRRGRPTTQVTGLLLALERRPSVALRPSLDCVPTVPRA